MLRRFTAWLGRNASARPERSAVVEEVEPRILYSADLNPALWAGEAAAQSSAIVGTLNPGPQTTAAGAAEQQQRRHEIVFVDAAVPDAQTLIDAVLAQRGLSADIEIVQISAGADGLEQIGKVLAAERDLDAIHIISHGGAGRLQLGNASIDAATIQQRAAELQGWRAALTADADLMLYGCDVAQGATGAAFVGRFAMLTGADVAASIDPTGSAQRGGDWELEYTSGHVETTLAFSHELQQNWGQLLNVGIDSTSTGTSAGGNFSVSHTTSGTDRLMLVGVSINLAGANSVSSISYNGDSLSLVGVRANGDARVEIWSLVAPDAGTFNVDIVISGTSDGNTAGVMTFTGVDQASALGAFASSSGTGGSGSATIGSAAGELVFAAIAVDDAANYDLAPGGGQTEHWDLLGGPNINGGGSTKAGAASVNLAWSWPGSDAWAIGGVSIKPAAISVTPTSGLATTEAGGTASFDVVLRSAPSDDVTIAVSSSDTTEGTVSTPLLTFTSANWNVAQTVTVTGVNDTLDDGNIAFNIVTGLAVSTDAAYSGLAVSDVAVSNTDDDTFNTVVVTNTSDSVNGSTASIAALLASDGGDGISLREAIIAANNTANGVGGADRIHFNIALTDANHLYYRNNAVAGTFSAPVATTLADAAILDFDADYAAGTARSWYRIMLGASDLNVTQAVIIDGSTQAGYDAAKGPIIEINAGAVTAGDPNALTLTSGASTVRGLVIHSADDNAIEVDVNADGSVIVGNYLGTDVSGTKALGNSSDGPYGALGIKADGVIVGGTTVADRNLFSGNLGYGVEIYSSATGAVVRGNTIGTTVDGSAALGNAAGGIYIWNGAANNTIGGAAANQGNLIASNGGDGVWVGATAGAGNAILGNTIYSNTGLAIDLGANGVTANDTNDSDSGANDLLNFPVVTKVVQNGANLDVTLVLDVPAGNYRIELYQNPAGIDPTRYGEGQVFLGALSVTSTGGAQTLSGTLTSVTATSITRISATATRDLGASYGSTSEFGPRAGLVVSTTADTMDGTTSSVAALISNPGADGQISLREAITAANATAGTDYINFDITAALVGGVHTITLIYDGGDAGTTPDAMPVIISPVVINGWTEPDYAGNPIIELNGNGVAATKGLYLGAGSDGSTIRGLIINRFTGTGIEISGSNNHTIQGNWIGLNASGTAASANGVKGIYATNSTGLLIGGTSAAQRNVISGNAEQGIYFDNVDNSTVSGNYVGTNAAGTGDVSGAVANSAQSGVFLTNGSSGNVVGGTSAGARNVLSGNNHFGFEVLFGSQNNLLQGNYIGTDVTGLVALGNINGGAVFWNAGTGNVFGGSTAGARNVIAGNTYNGVVVGSASAGATIQGNYIGVGADGVTLLGNGAAGVKVEGGSTGTLVGTNADGSNDAAERNVISGNTYGVRITDSGSTGTVVAGNTIGLAADGDTVVANSSYGVSVSANATNTTIGGTTSVSRNVISGNAGFGVYFDSSTSGNSVLSNYIGTNAAGTAARANLDGVWIDGGDNNTIGQAGAGNLISGNTYYGVVVDGAAASGNVIRTNLIGTDATGTSDLGNGAQGVLVSGGASATSIGGTTAGQGNTIAFNDGDGIHVAAGTGISILGNSIHSNTDQGIDLGTNGVTANDGDDLDSGANTLQNFPRLTLARTNGSNQLTLNGTLDSTANTWFRIEFFANTAQDGSGYGEGQTYLGSALVQTDGNGDANIATTLAANVAAGSFISATATQTNIGETVHTNTSEFARNVYALALVQGALVVDTTNDVVDGDATSISTLLANKGTDGFISLREAVIASNNTSGNDTINLAAGTYTLTIAGAGDDSSATGDLDIQTHITIAGAGMASAIISGGGIDRVMEVDGSGNLTMSDVRLTGGSINNDGGGLLVEEAGGSATLTRVDITGNVVTGGVRIGGGVHNVGTLVMTDSLVHGNTAAGSDGGGISNLGTATITRSSIFGNSARYGGGLHQLAGAMTIENVTVSGNTASSEGGGIDVAAGALTVRYSTIAGNSALGGNGGGVVVRAGTLTTLSSIFADNSSASGGRDLHGTFTSQGYNIIEHNAGFTGAVGTDQLGTDPSLAAHAVDASSGQYVHALNAGSIAVNAGGGTPPSTDQRGVTRDANPDVGAYERVNAAPVLDASGAMTFTTITEDQTATAGDLVSALISSAGGDRITDANGDPEGIAITALVSGNGSWEYSITDGASWFAIGTVSNASALLLRSTDRVRIVPNAIDATVGSITFRAWDRSSGTQGTKVSTVSNGGITAFSTATEDASITVTAVNDAPSATNLSAAETYIEDTALNLTDIVVGDVDSASVTATLTLSSAAAGNLNTGTSGAVTSTYNAGTGVWTASGAIADVNTLLAGLTFTPAANFNSNFSIATSVSDGVAAPVTGSKAMTGTAANDAPTASNLSAAETYTEDTALNLTDIVISDIDSANVTATLTLSSAAAGSLNTGTSGAVTSTYNAGTGVWTASGAIANVNTLLAGLIFTPAANFNSNFTIATGVSDAVAAPVTGSKAMTGTAVNDAPLASNLNAAETYTEDTALNLSDIVISDIDSASVTATLTLSNTAAGSLNTGTSGAVTSTYNAGTGVWTASGAIADVNALLAGLTFTPAANFNSNFTIATSVSDGVAPAVTGSKSMTGTAVNDAPVLGYTGGIGMVGTDENTTSAPTLVSDILTTALRSDADAAALSGIAVTSTIANGTFQYSTDGVTWSSFGSVSSSNALLLTSTSRVRYVPDGINGEVASFTFKAWDQTSGTASANGSPQYANPGAGGGTSAYSAETGSVVESVSAVNDAPSATNLSAAETYTEDTALNLTDIVISDVDSANATATLTLSNAAAGSLNTGTSGGVTSTYNAGTGVWTASGAIADVNALLAGLTFTPAANFNTNFTIATSVSDGVAAPATGSKAMTGTAVNDAPSATNLSAAETYTEDTALNLTDIVISDVDSANATATLTLSTTAAGSLNTGTSGAVTSTYNAGTGVWSASGAIANVNALLAGLTFTPAANFNSNFTIATSVSDGVAAPVTGSKAMTGTAVNDAPSASNLSAAETYTEDTALNLTDIVISDIDSANVTATLTLSNAAAGGLNTATSGAVTSTFNAGTGVWTASGAIADVNTLLAGLTFTPTANFNSNFTIATSVSDGVAPALTDSKAMTGTAVNDAPSATNLSAAETCTEDTALNLTDIVISDVDSASVTATLTLSNAAAGSLNTGTSGAVTSTFNAGTGVWTASGAIADVNTLLAGLTFTPTANFNSNFTIATSVNDGVAPALTGSKAMTGTAVNDPPIATNLNAAETYTEDTALNLTDIVISDVDSASVTATLTLSNSAAGSLNVGTSGAVTSTYNAGTGVWTASGAVADVNALLAGLNFTPAANFNANFAIATSVSDGVAPALTGSKAITGAAVNDAPVVTTTGSSLTYTENAAALAVDAGLTLSDADSAGLASATVSVSAGFQSAEDTLGFTDQNGISGTWNSSTGVLTLTGGATLAQYQAALRSITYVNGSDNPSTAARTVSFVVNDGAANSNTGTRDITVAAVNDAPLLGPAGSANTIAENGGAFLLAAPATVSDVDSLDFDGGQLVVAISANGLAEDRLTIRDEGSGAGQVGVSGTDIRYGGVLVGSFNGPVSGSAALIVTFNANADAAVVQAVTRNLTYENLSEAPSAALRTIQGYVTDGDGGTSVTVTGTLSVTPVNDAPTLGNGVLAAVAEDSANPAGQSVATIFAGQFADVDAGASLSGIAVVGNSANAGTQGSWQYSSDAGAHWHAIGAVADGAGALGLSSTTLIRFLPVADYHGTPPALTARGLDDSYAGAYSASGVSETRVTIDTSSNGGTTPIAAATSSVSTSVSPVNDAPTTSPVTLAPIAEDSGARLITQAELLANASDVDGPGLTATGLAISAGNGALIDNGNGTWTYTPALNDDASVSFSYNVTDGTASVAASATLDITPVNDAPTTTPVTLTPIAEDSGARLITQAELLANAGDVDGPSLTATGLTISAGNGALIDNGNGTWTYTPAVNDATSVSFSYTVTDGTASVAGSATLDITPVNDAPTTSPVTLAPIAEDSGARLITQAELLANASDVDGPGLTATGLAISAGNGALIDNGNGTWTYTPAVNDDASVSFSYSVTDGTASVGGSATLDITPVNDAPTTTPVTLTPIAEDSGARLITQAELLANASDVDGPGLTAIGLAISAGSGSLVDNGNGTWTYTPALDDATSVSFSYTVTDGTASIAASATLDITPVNDAPTTTPVTLTPIAEDSGARLITQAELLANASDVDGPGLTATGLAISAGNGTLIDNGNGTWTYTSAANDDASVNFSYTVTDGTASVAGSATLDITPVNDAPTTSPVTLTPIAEDSGARLITQAELLANASDVDGPSLTATGLAISAGNGALTDNGNGTWTYTPALNDATSVSFSYTVTDGTASVAGSATLDITPVNDAPTTSPVTLTPIAEDSGARLITQAELLANASDVDGPGLTATGLAISAGSGALTDNGNGTWTYTPAANDATSVSFSYSVTDGSASVAGNATLDITPVNDAPTTTPVTLTPIAEDSGARLITQAELLANASDVDGPGLTATGLAISAGNGALIDNGNGTWTYTPAVNDDASVSFSYTISDGTASVAGSATLDITPVNDAPTTTPVTLTPIAEDSGARLITQAELLANASDIDGPSLTATGLAISAGSGSLVDNGNGTWSYTPAANDDAAVSFTYTVTDGTASAAGSATLDIAPVNDAPTTTPVTLAPIAEDSGARLITQAELLSNASDNDGPGLAATGLTISAGNGVLTNNGNGTWTYMPAANDDTAVSFTYTVTDGTASVAGSATLDITPVNDAPTTTPVTLVPIAEDSGARLITQAELLANASDIDGPSLTATGLAISAGNGSLTDNADGTWTYTPATNDDTAVSFTYSVTDGSASVAGSAALDLLPAGDAPVITSNGGAAGAAVGIGENGAAVTSVTANDADVPAQALAYTIGGGADAALFTLDAATGALRFIAAPDFESPLDANADNVYDVVVQASDGTLIDTQAISVTVGNLNEAPSALTPVQALADENAPAGTLVATVSAVDPDAGELFSYTLVNDGAGRFAIDAASGRIVVAPGARLDFEAQAGFDLLLRVTDAGGQTYEQALRVDLRDLLETAPPPAPAAAPAAPAAEPPPLGPIPTVVQSASAEAAPSAPTEKSADVGRTRAPAPGPAGAQGEPSSLRLPGDADDETRHGSNAARQPLHLRVRDGAEGPLATISFDGVNFDETLPALSAWDDAKGSIGNLLRNANAALRSALIDADTEHTQAGDERRTPNTLTEMMQDPVRVASVTFTAGFIWWLTRSGGLLTTMLMGVPAWRHVDLLPVLARPADDEDADDEPKHGGDPGTAPAGFDDSAVAELFEPDARGRRSASTAEVER